MKNFELVIFDLDGTLVDSLKDITNAVNFTLRKFSVEAKKPQEVRRFIGSGVENLLKKALGNKAGQYLKVSIAVFEEFYRYHHSDTSKLYPYVKEILKYLKNKRKIVITNRNYEFAKLSLLKLGIFDYFADIIGGDDSNCMKPSACPINKGLNKLNMGKDKTVIVGDMSVDVLAGKNAGVATCAVTYGIGKRQDILKAKPDYIIDNILDLKKIIAA